MVFETVITSGDGVHCAKAYPMRFCDSAMVVTDVGNPPGSSQKNLCKSMALRYQVTNNSLSDRSGK